MGSGRGESKYHKQKVLYTTSRGSRYHKQGFDIPWVGLKILLPWSSMYHGYTIGRGFNIPWVRGFYIP